MIPIRDNRITRNVPIVTWTLILLNCIIFLWDRQWHLFGPSLIFADWGITPAYVTKAISNPFASTTLITLFTSIFIHANLVHLIGNMLFLLTFGNGVEQALRSPRYALYYVFWGTFAGATQVFVTPGSTAMVVGASGAIGGVLGAYLLLFPTNKIEILIPFVFIPVVASAWILLGAWFLMQILLPQEGVANWAHVGGFACGMATILIMGGREKALRGKEKEFTYDEDFN